MPEGAALPAVPELWQLHGAAAAPSDPTHSVLPRLVLLGENGHRNGTLGCVAAQWEWHCQPPPGRGLTCSSPPLLRPQRAHQTRRSAAETHLIPFPLRHPSSCGSYQPGQLRGQESMY